MSEKIILYILFFIIQMKKIKGIIKMVKMVDMFGTPIKFNIDGKDKY